MFWLARHMTPAFMLLCFDTSNIFHQQTRLNSPLKQASN